MGEVRKDSEGNVLQKGEVYRENRQLYSYSYTDENGKRKYLYSRDLNSLREKERNINSVPNDNPPVVQMKKTTGIKFEELFFRYVKSSFVKKTTMDGFLYAYEKYVKEPFGSRDISDIRYSDIKYLLGSLLENMKPSSMHSVNGLLCNSFEYGVRDELISKNPAKGVLSEIKKISKFHNIPRFALTKKECDLFLSAVKESYYYRFYPFFVFLLGTGCRFSEAIGLRWDDIDLEKRLISINHQCIYHNHAYDSNHKRRKAYFEIANPKSYFGIRDIPLLDDAYKALSIQKEYDRKYGVNRSVVDEMSGFVFSNNRNRIFSSTTADIIIKKILATVNKEDTLVRPFGCHNLRHTFCTRLCEKGINVKVIQTIMGHASVNITLNVYAEVTKDQREDILTEINSLVKFT